MKQHVAPTCLSIKIVTAFIFLLLLGFFIGTFFEPVLIWAVIFLFLIIITCYLYSPVAYALDDKRLVVIRRINNRIFAPVKSCTSIEHDKPSLSIRLWGNGGLFVGTGIFWNRQYGIFRAYVTTGNRAYLVLVETPTQKVIITPEDPEQFLNLWHKNGH